MGRLIVFALVIGFIAILAFAGAAAAGSFSSGPRAGDLRPVVKEDTMPATIRTIAYGGLILLMLGIVTGLVGGT